MELECKKRKKNMPMVAVLMSSYNGEKYIEEQLESILNQTYQNLVIYVRDDGSSDNTRAILEIYQKQGKIVLIKGENQGYISSFFTLLTLCESADYYAWCDQDDIWVPKKIERAVEWLERDREENKNEQIKPVLYFSGYDYYDNKMNYQKEGLKYRVGPSFANALMDCIALGFNSVFNDCARNYIIQNIPEHCCGHDWWTYMVCSAFGRVLYDEGFSSVKYRRLENSVSPGGKNFIEMQIWRFKKFFVNDYFLKIRKQLFEFSELYCEQLSAENQKIMKLFIPKKFTLAKVLKKGFYPIRFRQTYIEEIMVRILFLIRKL